MTARYRLIALICLALALSAAATWRALAQDAKMPSTVPQPPPPEHIEQSELKPELDGKQVVMTFEIDKTYHISGGVPVGRYPSRGITPVQKAGAPAFSVLVTGDLSEIMENFAMFSSTGPAKGMIVRVTGTIHRFEPPRDHPEKGETYQLEIGDWKTFHVHPPTREKK